ncbi:MAG TPA: glycosyl hydrolase family 28-related protein [Thermoanaerobaculia bacterium]|nr:glycosyl hydrolase family 28-related protein [Thermoanaerobaculia bacterium]
MARILLVLVLGAPAFAASPRVLNVRDFGAAGDGITDDYEAMQFAATVLCAAPSGSRLVYPPGTYRVDRFRLFRGPVRNGVEDITYRNCHGVTISGYGAKIEVKGDFFQPADFQDGGAWFSYTKQLTPFFLVDSTDFTIEGFEMDGNVDRMTRDPRSLEDASAGIMTRRCSRYLLRDLDIHHFSVDSILLGWLDFDDVFIADRDARVENVRGHHNGRVGLVIGHARGAWVVRSTFTDIGETDGAFPPFSPEAGVDVEPDFGVEDDLDVATGEVYFIDSTFRGCKGPEFAAASPRRVDSVVVYGANVVSESNADAAYAFVVGPKTALVERSSIDLRQGKGVILGAWNEDAISFIGSVMYARNVLRLASNHGLVSEGEVPYDFVDNDVRVTARGSDGSFMNLTGLRAIRDNRFFIAGTGSTGAQRQIVIRTEGTDVVSGNEYTTDYVPSGTLATSYGSTSNVNGELFPVAPRFSPADTAWNSTLPYPFAAPTPTDNAAPAISSLAAVPFSSSVLVSWLTDEAADSVVEYGPTPSYGRIARLDERNRYHPIFLDDLAPGTVHYRVRSTDAFGHSAVSADQTFVATRFGGALVETTSAITTKSSATLRGNVSPMGVTVTTRIEYGPTSAYGNTAAGPTLSGTATQDVSVTIPLPCGTRMHYRVVAEGESGTRFGDDRVFATTTCRRRTARS